MLQAIFFTACNNPQSNFSSDVAVPVSVEEVKLKSISQTYQTSGTVVAAHEITYASEMTGAYQLQKNPRTGRHYGMGDYVKKGEVIIRLENKEYENSTDVEGAKLDYDISKMEYEKQTVLYEKRGITLREKVDAERSLISAEKAYENAQIAIEKMKIKAPFDGIITALPYLSPGLTVESGTDMIGIMNFRELVMDLSFPENMLGKIKVSQKLQLMNYTAANDTMTGRITELSPAIDDSERTFAGRVVVDNHNEILKPGMFVRCEIELQKKDSVVVVPKELVMKENNAQILYVAQRETAHRRVLKTGLESKESVEVIEGLKPGERLIIEGYETLSDRSKIKIIN
jgi:RND family efflux transporter MFP subunit